MNDGDDNEQRCSRSGVNPSIVLTRAGDSRYYKMLPKAGNEIDITSRNSEGRFTKRLIHVSGVIYLSDYRWEIASQLPHCQPGWRGGETTFYRRKSVIIEPFSLSFFSLFPLIEQETTMERRTVGVDDFWINCPRQRFILIFGIITKVVLGYLNPLIRKIF